MIIFSCHNNIILENCKCEWKILGSFVEIFNKNIGRNYKLDKCLDLANRNEKQPEVLLKCSGFIDVTIERKSVVYPVDYVRTENNFHRFGEELTKMVGASPRISGGVLHIKKESLAKNIDAKQAAKEIHKAIEAGCRKGRYPFVWYLNPYEEIGIQQGIVIEANCSEEIDLINIREGFKESSKQALNNAGLKFKNYASTYRIVLLQFIGEGSYSLDSQDLEDDTKTNIVKGIYDEVWVAFPELVSELNYRIGYKRLWIASNSE
jgi:hypothetical protein